jgi:HPt (histidine-containing phosphotransfer) domain-containing protein
MNPDVIDKTVLRELEATTGEEFAAELIETFLQEAPGMLEELKFAAEASDAEGFRRAAHSIKSNANTFGLRALAEVARGVETGALESGASRLGALDTEYARAASALRECLHG